MFQPLSLKCAVTLFALLSIVGCGGSGGSGDAGSGESGSLDRTQQGGDTTVQTRTTLAFENPSSNLDEAGLIAHQAGDAAFGSIFVTPPATFNAGLGPLFNNNACDACHTKNGRGQPVFGNGPQGSQAVLQVSVASGTPVVPGGNAPDPKFGLQLQDHASFGVATEGVVSLTYETVASTFGDGVPYQLRRPKVSVSGAGASTQISMRIGPPIFGLGLLEAIPEATIRQHADPDDADGDGISGRPNEVWDFVQQRSTLGRFGRKANRANLRQQVASAYFNDIGVTNSIFNDGGEIELEDQILSDAEFYTQSIAVPVAGNVNDPVVLRGEAAFRDLQCASCHTPTYVTGSDHPVSSVRNQRIFPYTDLLLHDMGPGLADNRSDFAANGQEWKTPALWGVGITATILSSTQNYLHDGRARSLEEAILWHGGEAEQARERFRTADAETRAAIVAFLRSL